MLRMWKADRLFIKKTGTIQVHYEAEIGSTQEVGNA